MLDKRFIIAMVIVIAFVAAFSSHESDSFVVPMGQLHYVGKKAHVCGNKLHYPVYSDNVGNRYAVCGNHMVYLGIDK